MRKIKFLPIRISVSKTTEVVEILFSRNGHTTALIVRDEEWKRTFQKIFQGHEDSRAYDTTASYRCYITENFKKFRLFGALDDGQYQKVFHLHKVVDENGKTWFK